MIAMNYSSFMGLDPQLAGRIAKIDPPNASLLSSNPVTTASKDSGCWPGVQVHILIVHLPHGPVMLRYADDGMRVRRLAQARDLERESEARRTLLDAAGAETYARLLLQVRGQQLVERAGELPWLKNAPELEQAKKQVAAVLSPPSVRATGRGFAFVAHVVSGKELIRVEVELDRRGRVLEDSRRAVLSELPIAHLR